MDVGVIGSLFLPLFFVFACVFYTQRVIAKRRRLKGKPMGLYPTYSSVGNALQEMERMSRPAIEHVLVEKRRDDVEQDGEGDGTGRQ